MKSLLKLLVFSVIVLFPLASVAEKVSVDEMKSTCLTGFMKDADKTSDVDAYKSYVNNLCQCSANKVGDKDVDQAEVMASIGICMRITLLTESMSTLKDDDSITEDKISASCMKEWQIFTSTKPNQGTLEKSCACAAKEIMALDKDKRTDEEKLTQISINCADKDS